MSKPMHYMRGQNQWHIPGRKGRARQAAAERNQAQHAIAVELDAYRSRHGYEVVEEYPGLAPRARPRLAVRKRLVRLAKIQAMYRGDEAPQAVAQLQFPTWRYSLFGISSGGRPMIWHRDNYLDTSL